MTTKATETTMVTWGDLDLTADEWGAAVDFSGGAIADNTLLADRAAYRLLGDGLLFSVVCQSDRDYVQAGKRAKLQRDRAMGFVR